MCLYLGTSTRVPYLGTLTHVSLFWHIDTRVFTLAHRHMWFYLGTSKHEPYLGTSTHVPLSLHIDTCVFILARVAKFLHRRNRVLAFATTHEQPFPLLQYGIGGFPRILRCFQNEYRCAHLRPVLQVVVRLVPPSLWICQLRTVFFLTSCTFMTSTTYTSLEWW